MLHFNSLRDRRKARQRHKIKSLAPSRPRIVVHRSNQHMYAQLVDSNAVVLVSASTVTKELKDKLKSGSNIKAAVEVGKTLAKLALDKGYKEVFFDRSGFLYHGRVKALADAARETGLSF